VRNEAETRAELIDPALAATGWGVVPESRVRREVIAPGRILGGGRRGEPTTADYVLIHRGRRLAIVEAKAETKGVSEGLGQAKLYATKLQARFAFATNGHGLYRVDMQTGAEGPVAAWPTPDALWDAVFAAPNAWRDRFAAVAWGDKGGTEPPRYYAVNAAEAVLDAIAEGRERVLLTLATGTGKTRIAYQIARKLFEGRWSLAARETGEPGRRPRILFLADRNTLADQALREFKAMGTFQDDAMARISPDEIRKKGRVPKNASVFFTIFQTFTSGKDDALGRPEGYFGDYPPDFFDLVIIDECHRGGANDESQWRTILEYFAPSVQLGLTATPKRNENVDTYAYFGAPVYTYSLKQGIEDGFLTPFKVRQHKTTLDDYIYTRADEVLFGEVREDHCYSPGEFNRTIEIGERERYRVGVWMGETDPMQKALVFCASQDHAAGVRDLVNQRKTVPDPNYCHRVTSLDGAIGDGWLRQFQDNDKTIPVVLTTSQKLSTGVDARNVRHIVLMRPINSMIEFKQIVGRGTRVYEGKDYFTIHDFDGAYRHFLDPEWDGEPINPEPAGPKRPPTDGPGPPTPPDANDERERPAKVVIKLGDGKARTIQHISATSFWGPDGRPMTAQEFVAHLFGALPELFRDEDELRRLWSVPDTRRALLAGLTERGFGPEQLAEMQRIIDAPGSDIFDVLAYVGFNTPPITRAERAETRGPTALAEYEERLRVFLEFVLGQYVEHGVEELDDQRLASLLMLRYRTTHDARAALGNLNAVRNAFIAAQMRLFS
jgi:type I restriction enzyme R subunit